MALVAFEIVKAALGPTEARAVEAHGKSLDDRVAATLAGLGSKYSRLSSARKPLMDYSDPATQLAYLYGYVPAHAAFVFNILSEARGSLGKPLFISDTINLTSLGGGPGSDLLGTLKFLIHWGRHEPVKRVRVRILDKEAEWSRVCADLAQALNACGIELSLEFIQVDATDPGSLKGIDFSDEDLIAMSFFVSEVCCLDAVQEVADFFKNAFGSLKSGALILYNDNRDPAFRDFFDKRVSKAGSFETLAHDDAADMRLDSGEQSSVLAEYKARFGGRSTRLTGRTSYRLVRKK